MLNIDYDHYDHLELSQRYQSGVRWFFWIAVLSFITSLITVAGGGVRFLISLGSTQVIDAIAVGLSTELGNAPTIIGLVLDLILAGVFVVFYVVARKKYLEIYMLGMGAFVLDGLVSLLIQDLTGLIAHVVALIFLFRGLLAGHKLVALEARMVQQPPPVEDPATASSI